MSATAGDEGPLTRLAVVGCGRLATSRLYPCFPRLPVRLAGVCDLDAAKARQNARRYGGEAVFTDAAEMLDRTRPDGLVACVGPEAHVALALLALERGIPVYTEKPPAPSAREAWRVARAARAAGKLCMTAFKYRYAPSIVKAREIALAPEFGGLSALSLFRTSGPYKNEPGNARSSFLLDFCIHAIDQALFLGGAAAEVYACSPAPDRYALTIRFASGAAGALCFSCRGAWKAPQDRTELLGAAGHTVSIADQVYLTYRVDGQPRYEHAPRFCTAGGDSLLETGFLPELEAFVAHLRGERKVEEIPSRIAEAAQSMALYEAIVASAASGRPVTPERFADG